MKHLIVSSSFLCMAVACSAQDYVMKPAPIVTRWAKEVNPDNALKEYPRPQLVRKEWVNLNGLWEYSITDANTAVVPMQMGGKILVPFPVESALSGVKRALLPNQLLWYKRNVDYKPRKGERVMLHFGAVDYKANVYLNGTEIGGHEGGYTAFSFDITSALKKGNNELVVKVWDPSDQGVGPHGKQVLAPQNIYYTPTSGIWQTVWLETVPETFIKSLEITPDVDASLVNMKVNTDEDVDVSIVVKDGVNLVTSFTGKANTNAVVKISSPKLWSPAKPFLYDLTVQLKKGGKVIDEVTSYFGMRKISLAKDEKGFDRIMLNNQAYFNLGTLDQGFWPDGLYTAPTDEALKFDIEAIKAMGFNTIRKHIKVEPARWYYHADKIGMLVWQDFVNPNQGLPEGSKPAFEKGAAEEMQMLHNSPSLVVYTIFNEKWGQYDQQRLTDWVKKTEPTRLINGHSGEYLYVNNELRSPSPNAYVSADITDVHAYPDPMNSIRMDGKAQVCGEFGGIGVFIPDHQWLTGSAWGYVQEKPADLKAKYAAMVTKLNQFKSEGMSGSIYTQPFDVEGEQNGLITYDREVVKIPFDSLRAIHHLLNPDMGLLPGVTAINADLTDPAITYQKAITAFTGGSRDKHTLQEIVRGTAGIKDPGFDLMNKGADDFKKAMGNVDYSKVMSDIIFKDVMQAMFAESKPWEQIRESLRVYGTLGDETFLKIRSIFTYNTQDWENFTPVAKEYLQKYGDNIDEPTRELFKKEVANRSN